MTDKPWKAFQVSETGTPTSKLIFDSFPQEENKMSNLSMSVFKCINCAQPSSMLDEFGKPLCGKCSRFVDLPVKCAMCSKTAQIRWVYTCEGNFRENLPPQWGIVCKECISLPKDAYAGVQGVRWA